MYDPREEEFEDKLQTSNKELVQYVNNEWKHSQKVMTRRRVQATSKKILIRERMAEAAVKVVARLEKEGKYGNFPKNNPNDVVQASLRTGVS